MLAGRFLLHKNNGIGKSRTAIIALAMMVFVFSGILGARAAHAQVDTGLQLATAIGLSTVDIRTMVSLIIRAFLGLVGFVLVLLIMYAGYTWMTSQGDAEKITKAKGIITSAVIGVIIIISAYAIVSFIFRALEQGTIGGSGQQGGGPGGSSFSFSTPGAYQLGSGILEYHYPEPGQIDVPRNTKIAVTFKKPIALSSILANYDDKGTFDLADDTRADGSAIPLDANGERVLELNTANVKIIPANKLGTAGSGSIDDRFNSRYPSNSTADTASGAYVTPAPTARVTPVAAILDPFERQTLVIKFPATSPLGSPAADINYRVALRGGDNGLRVWGVGSDGNPAKRNAFDKTDVDGAYFWNFTTNTTIDTTPPKIEAVVPKPRANVADPKGVVDRNQLLQVHFNEAVDPTSASGQLGLGGGFNKIDIQAVCQPGTSAAACPFNNHNLTSYTTIDGLLTLGNRYRTAEFLPSAPCDGVSANSCNQPVFCLPKNVSLLTTIKAASVAAEAPQASVANGVTDMADNSLDGNGNGISEGQIGTAHNLNSNSGTSDIATALFNVGENIDLVPPVILYSSTTPRSTEPPSAADAASDLAYPAGPSRVPVTAPVATTWSKRLSINSLRTGRPSDLAFVAVASSVPGGQPKYVTGSTVIFDAFECRRDACDPGTGKCTCTELDPPSFYTKVTMIDSDADGESDQSRLELIHREFLTANQLGYNQDEIQANQLLVPQYIPSFRAQIQDDRQNCFSPSVGANCPSGTMRTRDQNGNLIAPSCCNVTASGTFICTPQKP